MLEVVNPKSVWCLADEKELRQGIDIALSDDKLYGYVG